MLLRPLRTVPRIVTILINPFPRWQEGAFRRSAPGVAVQTVRPPRRDIYRGQDPAELPSYSIPEAAHNLQLAQATVRSWVLGRKYHTEAGVRTFQPVVRIAEPAGNLLSFLDLTELHVLSAIRRDHRVRLSAVRRAIEYLRKNFQTRHPLSSQQMLTDGKNLLIERYGELVNVSRAGQMEMKHLLDAYLSRIKYDRRGVPIRLFPFTRPQIDRSPLSVVIDPRVQFGRPCLAGTGIPTAVIIERYKAGDSIETLAADYGRPASDIEEAIRYEHTAA